MSEILEISPSGLSLFSTCRRAFYYAYHLKIEKNVPRASYFEKGTYAHSVMHAYFAMLEAGIPPGSNIALAKLQQRILADMSEAKDAQRLQMIRDVSSIVKMYVESLSKTIDSKIIVEGIEQYLRKEITLSNGTVIALHGYVDLIYSLPSGTLVVRDLKTGEDPRTWSPYKVAINVQLLSYLYLAHLTYPEVTKFRGEILFLLTKFYKKEKTNEERFKDLPVSYTADELDSVFLELEKLLIDASSLTEANATMALDKDACGRCAFQAICNEKLRGKDTKLIIQNLYRKRESNRGTQSESSSLTPENTSRKEPTDNSLRLNLPGWN